MSPSTPVIRVLFEGGSFTAQDTLLCGGIFTLYALGMAGFFMIDILNKAYYAMGKTLMPLAVSVPWNHVEVYSTIAEAVKDTVITFVCPDARVAREVERYCYGHVVSVPAGERVGVVSKMRGNVMIHSECVFREDMGDQLSGLCEIHAAGISGDPDSDCPLICDVTGTWDVYGGDAAQTSILEGESVLNAMLCGADVLFVRSPAAADVARFYGEELSGL